MWIPVRRSRLSAPPGRSGVLGAYFLLFPGNKIEVFSSPSRVSHDSRQRLADARGLVCMADPFAEPGVANWRTSADSCGMVTVLIMGGRSAILHRPDAEYEIIQRNASIPKELRLNLKILPVWLYAMAFLAPALLSIFSIYRRDQAESLNRAVSFAVDLRPSIRWRPPRVHRCTTRSPGRRPGVSTRSCSPRRRPRS